MMLRAQWTIPGNVRPQLEQILRKQGFKKKSGERVFTGHSVEIDYGARKGDAPNTTAVRLLADDASEALSPYGNIGLMLGLSFDIVDHSRDASLDLALHVETLELFQRGGAREHRLLDHALKTRDPARDLVIDPLYDDPYRGDY